MQSETSEALSLNLRPTIKFCFTNKHKVDQHSRERQFKVKNKNCDNPPCNPKTVRLSVITHAQQSHLTITMKNDLKMKLVIHLFDRGRSKAKSYDIS